MKKRRVIYDLDWNKHPENALRAKAMLREGIKARLATGSDTPSTTKNEEKVAA